MADPPDVRCQWCHKTIAIATPQGLITVAEYQEFEGKSYCDGETGTCWADLLAMTKYVNENFTDGRSS